MNYLINTIFDYREAVIFLGGGASMEGKQDEKMFPGSDDLIDRVLQKYGVKPKNKKERLDLFFEILKQWEKEKRLALRLREFLDGEPGLAHYYLAALSIALFGESNTLLYLTKNFDDLINQAFKDLQKNPLRKFKPVVISIHPNLPGSEFQEIVINTEANLNRGCPVILKLFGDLNFQKRILKQEEIKFQPEVEKKLIEWMKKPMIVIGYSFSDNILKQLLIASMGVSPVFLINPFGKIPPDVKGLDRVHHIKCSFSDCVNKLLEIFHERNPAINRKIDKILQFLDPTTIFPDFNSIENRVQQCSKASILRAEERIPKIEVKEKVRKLIPIPREDTSPDFERFLQSDRPLLSVIGDSGSGKSTLLYRVAKNEFNKHFITLFYDVHHIQSSGSLTEKLSQDFRCEKRQLETMLEHFDKILSYENKKLLIMIDGLNESIKIDPSDLKIEIEDLGAKLPQLIKIVYSCRTVYWDSYIKVNTPISSALYYGSKEFILYFYSKKEAKRAFATYKDLFEFQGSFESLKNEFKEKIRDPLMLRMLAEGYQGKKLPAFAPAVKIFRYYEKKLEKKFTNTLLIKFMNKLVSIKLRESEESKNVSDQFSKKEYSEHPELEPIIYNQIGNPFKPGDPWIVLEDEGILSKLDEAKGIYRFTYDRFFEYLLGKEIGKQFKINSKEDFVTTLAERILNFQRVHFSFLQALKSEIIRHNIGDSKGVWSFYDTEVLKALINNRDAAIVNFTKEVLRELTFESEEDILPTIKSVKENELSWKLLVLDIAGDSPKVKHILIEGLFSGDKHFIRRCVYIISNINMDSISRKNLESLILSEIKNRKSLTENHYMGLIYYTSSIFTIEDILGNDPFEKIKILWKSNLSNVKKNNSAKLKDQISTTFTKILKNEFYHFFSEDLKSYGIEYLWEVMSPEIRDAAMKMAPLIVDSNQSIDNESQEILRFFGAEIKDWNNRNILGNSEKFFYRLEYGISMWILILHSKTKFEEVKRILNSFVATGYRSCIDFSLGVMGYILEIIHYKDKEKVKEGFEIMKKWTAKFEKYTDIFYETLDREDPFNASFNALVQASRVDTIFFAPSHGPITFLEDRLISSDLKKVRLALLATRYLWREYPKKILGTLELVINHEDEKVNDWSERILKEIYCVYPRLIEDFFWKNNINPQRIQAIKFRPDVLDPSHVVYQAEPFYKALFLGPRSRRLVIVKWYKKLLNSTELDSYCNALIGFILKSILD
jgi:GTPase SAR1 family protein